MNWSNNLAYCVGLITTDGNLSKDGRHISLTSKDWDQVINFLNALQKKCRIGQKSSSYGKQARYYVAQFSDKVLYLFLLSIGLHPNKTKTLKSLLVPDKYFADFLRGHLDGDGFTYSYWDKRWKSSFMLYTGFTSASHEHLVWIQDTVSRLYGIKGTIKYAGKSTYQLIFAKRSSLILLNKIYHRKDIIYLKRKRFKIEQSLSIIQKQAGMLKLADRHA